MQGRQHIHEHTHCALCDITHMQESIGRNSALKCQEETTVPSECTACFTPDILGNEQHVQVPGPPSQHALRWILAVGFDRAG